MSNLGYCCWGLDGAGSAGILGVFEWARAAGFLKGWKYLCCGCLTVLRYLGL